MINVNIGFIRSKNEKPIYLKIFYEFLFITGIIAVRAATLKKM